MPALADRARCLHGARIVDVTSRGKALLIAFDAGLVHFSHNQLYGKWRVMSPRALARLEAERGPSMRVVIATARRAAVLLSATTVELLDASAVDAHPFLARLGPDVLDRTTAVPMVRARLASPAFARRSLASLLLDQRFLAGPGNYLRSEILHVARVHPDARPCDLDADALDRFAWATLAVPRQSLATGGITNERALVRALADRGATFEERRFRALRPRGQAVLDVRDAHPPRRRRPRHLLLSALPAALTRPPAATCARLVRPQRAWNTAKSPAGSRNARRCVKPASASSRSNASGRYLYEFSVWIRSPFAKRRGTPSIATSTARSASRCISMRPAASCVEGDVTEVADFERRAEQAIDVRQHVAVEERGDAERVVVGGLEPRPVLVRVDADQQAAARPRRAPRRNRAQERGRVRRREVADRRAGIEERGRHRREDVPEVEPLVEVRDDACHRDRGKARRQPRERRLERASRGVDGDVVRCPTTSSQRADLALVAGAEVDPLATTGDRRGDCVTVASKIAASVRVG